MEKDWSGIAGAYLDSQGIRHSNRGILTEEQMQCARMTPQDPSYWDRYFQGGMHAVIDIKDVDLNRVCFGKMLEALHDAEVSDIVEPCCQDALLGGLMAKNLPSGGTYTGFDSNAIAVKMARTRISMLHLQNTQIFRTSIDTYVSEQRTHDAVVGRYIVSDWRCEPQMGRIDQLTAMAPTILLMEASPSHYVDFTVDMYGKAFEKRGYAMDVLVEPSSRPSSGMYFGADVFVLQAKRNPTQ